MFKMVSIVQKSKRNINNLKDHLPLFSSTPYGGQIAAVLRIIFILLTIIHLSQCQISNNSSFISSDDESYTTPTLPSTHLVKRQITSLSTSQVQVVKLQRFLVEPDNMTVNIGESVILPCRVSNKAGTVQWTRDGFGLGADPRLEGYSTYSMIHNDITGDYSLKISSVTLEDDAVFQCQVGALDNVPGIRSQNAKLTIRVRPEDPVIVFGQLMSPHHHYHHNNFVNANNNNPSSNHHYHDQIQVLTTTAGTKIELTCEAHGGRPAAELSWINSRGRIVKKGITSKITTMNDGKRYNTALKWVFEPTKSDHQKKLLCRSSHPTLNNSSRPAIAAIMLEVKYSPEVKLEVSRIVATMSSSGQQSSKEQDKSQISPSSSSSQSQPQHINPLTVFGATNLHGRVGDTIKFKCIADGNPGKSSLMFEWLRDNEVIFGDHGNELIIDNVDKSFNGAEIVCRVSNSVGTGMASVTLNIAFGPLFLPSMEYVYGANPGDTVRLNCPVEGNPSPDITWIKVGTSSVMSSGSKLTIRNVNEESVGEYLCRVSVKGFPEISAIIYLRLNGPPKIRKKKPASHHYYAVMGEPGHLECLIESIPPPIAITWIHNGQIFTSGSTNNIPINIDIHEEPLKEEAVVMRASYDIRSTLQHDFGYYNCVVVNSYGSDWHIISLNEKTSFSTIVICIVISISILLFVVLSTIVFLLTIKHRKLMREQKEQEERCQKEGKEHFHSDNNSDNHIYSTHSTRTNSSTDKNGPTDTGTIITRSGSTGSPRSSTSSFPAYLDHNSNRNSPGPTTTTITTNSIGGHPRIMSNTMGNHHRSTPLSTRHIHSPSGLMFADPPPPTRSPFFNSMFESSDLNSPLKTTTSEIVAMPPINSVHYSTLSRHLAFSPHPPMGSSSSIRNSHSPYGIHSSTRYHPTTSTSATYGTHSDINPNVMDMIGSSSNDMYQANPYQVLPNNNNGSHQTTRVKSNVMPTPTPTLAKELDNCISSLSVATHV